MRAKSDEEARARLDTTFDSGDPKLLAHYRELAADHLEVIAGDKGEANLGLDRQTWQRLADTVDLIVDPAALVNHVLPYSELFGPNALGTAELIRIALTRKQQAVHLRVDDRCGRSDRAGEVHRRRRHPGHQRRPRAINDSYANGYGNSKWAGEVLLREAHDLCGLPVAVFRCDMILADTTLRGSAQRAGHVHPDDPEPGGHRYRARLVLRARRRRPPAACALRRSARRVHRRGDLDAGGAEPGQRCGFQTYHVMNPYDDGIGFDEFVDWLIEAGYPIQRIGDYGDWLQRFETTLRALPEQQRQARCCRCCTTTRSRATPINGSMAPTDRFRAAVQDAKIGPDKDIPHVSPPIIVKYVTDLQLLGLL